MVFNRTYSYLNERAFVSFEYKGETFLFNVMTVEEDEKKIKCYCENLNLELINEYSNPFKADRAMSFVEYCNAMDLLNMTKLSVGINEVSDYKRTLEWEGQDTKLARLISLANKFDAEIEFKTYLNDDSTIKQFLVNVYHENDGVNYHGVGRDRKDITLVYGKNIKTIRRKIDKTNIFNMIVPTAQSEENSDQKLTIKSLPDWELKNDKGIVEFYKRGDTLFAPISAQLYPSTFTSETQSDQWTRRDMEFNVKSIQQLETEGLKQLKASAYPELTYEFDGYIDADIGDTVELSDSGFANTLLIEARIFEQKLSFSTRKNWKTTLGNFRALQSKLSNDIQSELERLVEMQKPYNIRISTDNGTMFKNNEGESLVKATLWKGGKVVNQDVSWRWALDGVVTVGMQYRIQAKDITDTAVLTVAAYVGNAEVATTEITLTNVNDGVQGPQGPKGEDGIAGKDGVGLKSTLVTYGLSASETTQPTGWSTQVPTLTKGNYLWTKTIWTYTDNTSETGYQKTYIARDGNDGNDGIPGKDGVGIKTTTITYAGSTSGTTKPTSGWTSTIPSVPAGQYLWTKTVWTYTDGTSETGYSVAKMGENGQDGQNSYMHTAYANITKLCDENKNFTITTSSIVRYGYADKWVYKTFEAGTYAATSATFGKDPYSGKVKQCDLVTDFSLTDSTGRGWLGTYSDNNANAVSDPSRYTWQLTKGPQGIQGIQGPQGIPGKPGADGRTQYTHIAYADNATGGGFSQTDQNKSYIGMYVDFTAADSNDPTRYRWTKWKGSDGAQGVPGKPGADGKTPYIHFAYADDDKGTNFSLTDKNQQYQGYYSDYTQADSNEYRKYKWVDRLANVQVGGVNLLTGTRDWSSNIQRWANNNGVWNDEAEDYNNLKVKSTTGGWNGWHQNIFVKSGEYYTLSYYAKADENINVRNILTWEQSPIFQGPVANFDGSNDISDNITTEWKRYSRTVKITGDGSLQWRIEYDGNALPNGKWYIAGMKLERGNIATDYSQAPEDTKEQIDSKADSALTQEQLNALEAKRLQMETEMKALATLQQVSKLETFINNLKQEDTNGRQKIIETAKAIEERVKDIEPIMEYSKKLQFMDTYITQGNGGMVIGANNSSTKVVVTPDRISFQSGGSEVAYISQSMLHIDNGVFTMSLQLGHYITRAHPKNEYVNATYFVK